MLVQSGFFSPRQTPTCFSSLQLDQPSPSPPYRMSSSAPSQAKLIGSLLFCPVCSTLLDLPGDKDIIVCEQCHHEEPAQCLSPSLPSSFAPCFPSFDAEPKRFAFVHASDSVREPRRQDVLEPVGVPIRAQGQAGARRQGRRRGPGERSPRRSFPRSLSFCSPSSSSQQTDPADKGVSEAGGGERGCAGSKQQPTSADPLPLLPCSRRLMRSARTAGTLVCRTKTSSCVVQTKGRQRSTLCVPCTLSCSSL